ncbi:30S ribosome-binding factor RbfA [Flavobacteriaceae bacterium Ap0902]|nr:30S ribosome-binding factor RbfA [Flavobacteriaceae bacterium Ap0902]
MESKRLQRVNQLMQQELAEIFRKEAVKIKTGMLISVTEVRTTPDLSIAKVYLSVFPTLYRDEVFKYIDSNQWYFRKELGSKIGKQMRIVPELHYFADDSLDKVDEIDRALKGKGENPTL